MLIWKTWRRTRKDSSRLSGADGALLTIQGASRHSEAVGRLLKSRTRIAEINSFAKGINDKIEDGTIIRDTIPIRTGEIVVGSHDFFKDLLIITTIKRRETA